MDTGSDPDMQVSRMERTSAFQGHLQICGSFLAVTSGHWLGRWATGVIGLVETGFSLGVVKVTLTIMRNNMGTPSATIQETSPVGNTLVKETDK